MALLSQHKTFYILAAKEWAKMLQYGIPKCRQCGRELKIGDAIISNNRYKKMNKKYHIACYERLFQ